MRQLKQYFTLGAAFFAFIFSLCANSMDFALPTLQSRENSFFSMHNSLPDILPVVPRSATVPVVNIDLKRIESQVSAMRNRDLFESLYQSSKMPVFTSKITEDSLENWLAESGIALIKSFADREFPNLKANELESFQIGKPVKVYLISQKQEQNGFPIFNESNLRLASILDAEKNAVGVIQVELNTDATDTRQVFRDAKLGQSITSPSGKHYDSPALGTLLYDSVFEAYFLVKDDLVEPASAKAEKILLGSIPSKDFFILRKNIIEQNPSTGTTVQQQKQKANADYWGGFILKIIVFLLLGIIFSFSICYLVWAAKNERGKAENKLFAFR